MDVNAILFDILVVLVAAKVAAEIADRIGVPAVVGEIAAGVLVGPSAFGLVETNEVLHTLAEVGVILLLLQVGLEMDLRDLRSVGRASLLVAVLGVVVPMAAGAGTGFALGMDAKEALFVGAALTATSVGITARVFGDLRALATVEARTVLGAAVADDVLGLVILTVVARIATEGSVSVFSVVEVVAIATAFVVFATAISLRVAPPVFRAIRRYSRSTGTLVALAFAFTLGLSELAHAADLAPIIGAFVAGLALTRTPAAERIRGELAPIGHLLVPVFFLKIGIDADVEQFAKGEVLGVATALLAVGILGKLVASAGLVGRPGDRLLVGIGMVPRGEVGLIFATIGLREGVFGQDVYGALILVVLATTVLTPPALRWRLLQLRARRRVVAAGAGGAGARVEIDRAGRVTVVGEPLPADALALALVAARLSGDAAPSDDLLEWLDAFPPGPRRWDDAARAELWRLLEEGNPRSWRLLTAAGVLARALPELDEVLERRHGSNIDLDPLAALSFRRLAAVREALDGALDPATRRTVLLASLVLDACDDIDVQPVAVARRTAQRLDLGTPMEQAVAALVADAELLVAAARRVDALEEESVLQLAVHLAEGAHARALHIATAATFGGDIWVAERVDELHQLIQESLAHPELTGRGAANEVGHRVAAACARTEDPEVRERIRAAPRAHVLRTTAAELERHANLCEQVEHRFDIHVRIELDRDGYRLDIATRDQVGLLAAITHALADAGCNVTGATAVTWGDGIALSSYRIGGPLPDPASLAEALRLLLATPPAAAPMPDVDLVFDDHGSPWYTRCTVEADDRLGLLHAVTTAFARAGVNVHAARITTEHAHAIDTFELTERDGAKLADASKARVREVLASGAVGGPSRFRRRRIPGS
ncbi:MAG: cation:proton antiporter domain-containing protein [Actinomycetota bacterium]